MNLNNHLLCFRELLNVMPKEGEPVNWRELEAHKETAKTALNHMMIILSSQPTDVQLVGCKWLDPTYSPQGK